MSRAVLALVAVVIVVAPARPARACRCRGPLARQLAPSPGALVPPNVRVWLENVADDVARVLDADGAEVPLDASRFANVLVLTPRDLLVDAANYTVEIDEAGVGAAPLATFTVFGDVDDVPPDVPVVTGATSHSDPFVSPTTCPASYSTSLSVSSNGAILVFDRARGERFDADALAGDVTGATTTSPIFVGTGACGGSNWPEAWPLATTSVVVGAFDVAGNFSGFSEPRAVILPPPGCDCDASKTTTTARSYGDVVLVAVVVLLRRASSRRPVCR